MAFPLIDVIIPCYNCADTLARAVNSLLAQEYNRTYLGHIWLVDDGSTDKTSDVARSLMAEFPQYIYFEQMPSNSGVAKARNWGALQSQAEFIAFLDADDAYEDGALEVASSVFHFCPDVNVLRLALKPVGLAERYGTHPDFKRAWQYMQMTCGGNLVFQRAFFLACGGFPPHALFRRFGGEDGALGIATTKLTQVGTLFDEVGVLHYCREGMHAERLLDNVLFNKMPPEITADNMAQAETVTAHICQQIERLKCGLNSTNLGVKPLRLERAKP